MIATVLLRVFCIMEHFCRFFFYSYCFLQDNEVSSWIGESDRSVLYCVI